MAMTDLILVRKLSSKFIPRRGKSPISLVMGGVLVFLLALIGFNSPAVGNAQQLTATLSGEVTDSTGAVIPNATVTVTQTTTNAVRVVPSDGGGNYSVASLPAGTYNVSVSSQGFETFVAKNVILN